MNRRRFLFVMGICGLVLAAPSQSARRRDPVPDADSRIDINHATVDELMRVPGMTRIWALRIVRFRPYRMKSDLIDRGVVSNEVYERIKDYVIAHRVKQ
jgi:DNA uptake protein ComE-like DNA-binding protein